MRNLSEILLSELSEQESKEITGGDKFMRDLGEALGYAWEWTKENYVKAATYWSSLRM